MLTMNEMEKMLDEIAESFPPEIFQKLNGGINLQPEMKLNPIGKDQDLFILGEYHFDSILGRYITIYFGSMTKVYGYLSRENMMEKLKSTLKHEFRHHLESLAGEKDLEIADKLYIEAYLKRNDR